MNIGQVKVFSWITAALLTAGLGWYVLRFVGHLDVKRRGPDPAKVLAVLEGVPAVKEKASDIVLYDDVRRLYLPSCERCKNDPKCPHLNWTGKPPPPPPDTTVQPVDTTPKRTPVKDLVRILMVQVDLADGKQSGVFLKYKADAKVSAPGVAGGFLLHAGDRLAAPQDKIRVEAIRAEGVVFAFDDPDRPSETLAPSEYDLKAASIVQVGPDGVRMPALGSIPKGNVAPFRPGKTTATGQNRYQLGTEDAAYIGENYATILSQDLRWDRHHDPKTGKYDGIEIKSVTPGSIAEQHGAHEGDIIKSINGQPVTSVQEAINFAKMHANEYTTWEVVVESNGKLKTITYHSPQQ